MKKKNKLHSLLFLLFITLFLISAYMVCKTVSQAQQEQSNFERLEETIKYPSAVSDPALTPKPSETDALLPLRSLERAKP